MKGKFCFVLSLLLVAIPGFCFGVDSGNPSTLTVKLDPGGAGKYNLELVEPNVVQRTNIGQATATQINKLEQRFTYASGEKIGDATFGGSFTLVANPTESLHPGLLYVAGVNIIADCKVVFIPIISISWFSGCKKPVVTGELEEMSKRAFDRLQNSINADIKFDVKPVPHSGHYDWEVDVKVVSRKNNN